MSTENKPRKRLTIGAWIFIAFLLYIAYYVLQEKEIRSQRGHVAECMSVMAESTKKAVTDYYNQHKAFPPHNAAAGLAAPTEIQSKGVSSMEVSTMGTGTDAKTFITITYNGKVDEGKTMILSAAVPEKDKPIAWDCKGGTLGAKYRPAECRP